jgi:ABC-type lipoprotein export system ATPase subunit
MKIKKISVENLWNKHTFSINFNKDVTILIGKNGSGKSTVLNLIYELLANSKNSNKYRLKEIELLSFDNEIIFNKIGFEYLFLSTFDMEVKNREIVQKNYNGKSHIKTDLDVILNNLVTNFKFYLLKIKEQVEKVQKEFDKELELYTNANNTKGLREKILEKKKKIDTIYKNRDLFTKKINELFKDTDKHITLDENNSIVFQLDDKSYLTPYQLSSGEKQILIIMLNIMLLENKPTILLMDEPEISLHVEWQRVFIEMLLALNPNLQIIIATHSPAIVSKNFRSKVVSLSNFRVKD